jgi:hypothetical protein
MLASDVMTRTRSKPPWEQPAPQSARHTKLSPRAKKQAAARARDAGRRYPNLVDNMQAAAESHGDRRLPVTRARRTTRRRTKGVRRTTRRGRTKGLRRATRRRRTKGARGTTRPRTTRATQTTRPPRASGARRKTSPRRTRRPRRVKPRATLKDPRGGLTAAGRRDFGRRQGAHLKPGVGKPEARMSPQEMRRKGSWATRFYGRRRLPALVDAKGRPTRFALTAAAWGEPVPRTPAAARRIAAKGRRLLERYRRSR